MKCVFVLLCVGAAWRASACDLCAVYSAASAQRVQPGWSASVSEQFTHYATLQEDGSRVADPVGQRLDSSITQLAVGYQFNGRFGLQFTLPVIHRAYRRPEDGAIETGHETGIGDASLVGQFRLVERMQSDTLLLVDVQAGLKLPTGDSARLHEELHEMTPPPGAEESGIHGHDLALGSGSFDGVLGAKVFAGWKRAFMTASLQAALRGTGDIQYRYAHDLMWRGGPGVFVWMNHGSSLSLQFTVSGETKGTDVFAGEVAEDTGLTAVFVGPAAAFNWRDRLSADVALDLPVLQDNTARQVVADWRLRSGLTWRF